MAQGRILLPARSSSGRPHGGPLRSSCATPAEPTSCWPTRAVPGPISPPPWPSPMWCSDDRPFPDTSSTPLTPLSSCTFSPSRSFHRYQPGHLVRPPRFVGHVQLPHPTGLLCCAEHGGQTMPGTPAPNQAKAAQRGARRRGAQQHRQRCQVGQRAVERQVCYVQRNVVRVEAAVDERGAGPDLLSAALCGLGSSDNCYEPHRWILCCCIQGILSAKWPTVGNRSAITSPPESSRIGSSQAARGSCGPSGHKIWVLARL